MRSAAHFSMHALDDPDLPKDETYDSAAIELNFRLEDLLNFSNDSSPPREEEEEEEDEEGEGEEEKSIVTHEAFAPAHYSSQEIGSNELCIPSDELAYELEWLSAFNEDSSYSGDRKLAFMVSSEKQSLKEEQSCSLVSVLEEPGDNFAYIPLSNFSNRARSKRSRGPFKMWSLDTIIPTLIENKLHGAQAQESLFNMAEQKGPSKAMPYVMPSVEKKAKKDRLNVKTIDISVLRRCSHCFVQKTPQWRAGPMGPKTLCNACGVRYKSGRLLPEYRPAGSPTFLSEVHSNSHKRVLEMRRLKEMGAIAAFQEELEREDEQLDCNGKQHP